MKDAPLFKLFWENSQLTTHRAQGFAEQLEESARHTRATPQLYYPHAPTALRVPDDALAQRMASRRSSRSFGERALTERELGGLFFGFHERAGHRAASSAGARYPIEVFAYLWRVEGRSDPSIVYYNPDLHALSHVGPAPSWRDVSPSVRLQITGEPAALFVFVGVPERTTSRYGERGGRFVLIECGQLAQNLALRVAQHDLAGVQAGGLDDARFGAELGLATMDALILLGYVVGASVERA